MINIIEYIRDRNRLIALVLLALGLAFLWGSTCFEFSSQYYLLMVNLGSAFIVTAVAMSILSYAVVGIERKLEKEINQIVTKLDVLGEAKKCGIVHIFESRRKDPNFKKELITQFENVAHGEEILMMSNSLRDFFGPKLDNNYLTSVFELLRKGVKFRILLLDPLSEAAKDRAVVEEKERFESKGYINTTLFIEIRSVAERLDDPSRDMVVDESLSRRMKDQIRVRFCPFDPTTHLVITDKVMFIEQYHRGGDTEIRRTLEREGIPYIDCFGGFVPALMVDGPAFFTKLMTSHFNNIWSSREVEKRGLRRHNYFRQILLFENNEKMKLTDTAPAP